MRRPCRMAGSARPCALPRNLGRLRGVYYSAFVETSSLCHKRPGSGTKWTSSFHPQSRTLRCRRKSSWSSSHQTWLRSAFKRRGSLLAILGYRDTRPSMDSALILFCRQSDRDGAYVGNPALSKPSSRVL